MIPVIWRSPPAVAMVLCAAVLSGTASSGAEIRRAWPSPAEIAARDPRVRAPAVRQFLLYRRTLVAELLAALNTDHAGKPEDDPRASACFVIGQMRASDPPIIDALVAIIDKDFIGAIKDIPYGKSSPPDALAKIGKPAVPKLLETVREDTSLRRRARALWSIHAIEGAEASEFLLERALARAKTPDHKANLTEALERLAAWHASAPKAP